VVLHLSLNHGAATTAGFYTTCVLMGIGVGYWAMFIQVAAEQFGTNIRSTVTTSVPNFVRGAVIPLTAGFQFGSPRVGVVSTAIVLGMITLVITLVALWRIEESFHKDLDYHE
jgi:MFS transporter, putative metabolite:H+ symporter